MQVLLSSWHILNMHKLRRLNLGPTKHFNLLVWLTDCHKALVKRFCSVFIFNAKFFLKLSDALLDLIGLFEIVCLIVLIK